MRKSIVGACIGFLLLSGAAYAQQPGQSEQIERLQKTVEEQNRTISDLMRRLESLEANQKKQEEHISEQKEEKPLWTDRITISGDFRYRNDWADKEGSHVRERNRIRVRLGAKARLSDDLDVGVQLATGETEFLDDKQITQEGATLSNNQTLGDAWSLKNFWISQAYFNWHPEHLVPGFTLMGGKMARPFFTVGGSELLWDPDLYPEGGVIKYARSFDSIEVFANLYGFWTMERSTEEDSGMLGGQAGLKYSFEAFGDDAHVLGGISDYNFLNTKGKKTFLFSSSGAPLGFGNTLNPDGTYATGFNEVEPFGELGFRVRSIPVLLFADYVNNTDADDDNNGWLVGFSVGKAGDPGSWEFKYFYRLLERNAVLGVFTDDDFGGGGTDVKGSALYLKYKLTRNVSLAATCFLQNKIGIADGEEEIDYNRVFLDVMYSF